MQFDATLNLAWALLGLFALAATARVALRQDSRRLAVRWLLIVGLIVTALFPYISASDDILRLGHTTDVLAAGSMSVDKAIGAQSPADPSHQADDLLRLYETLDTPLACRLVSITLQFLLIAWVLASACGRATRVAPELAGRSPPLPSAI